MIKLKLDFSLPLDHIHAELKTPPPFKGAVISFLRISRLLLKLLRSGVAGRSQNFVAKIYEDVYSASNEQWLTKNRQRRIEVIYKKKLFLVDGFFLRQIHNQIISHSLNELGCQSALEVGSGRGNNIVSLAGANPNINFTGLEVSPNGIKQSLAWAGYPNIKPELLLTGSSPVKDFSFKNLTFKNGNALAMPFPDNSFDAAFTILVLEQLPYNYHKVLEEMRRVSRKYCLFIEPFTEVNSLIGRLNLKKSDYFTLRYRHFERLGLKAIKFFDDYPQKIKYQSGLLVTQAIK